MHFIICIIFYDLYSMHCVLCIVFYALFSMHCVLCIVFMHCFYALCSMHCNLCMAFNALCSMHCSPYIVFYALYWTRCTHLTKRDNKEKMKNNITPIVMYRAAIAAKNELIIDCPAYNLLKKDIDRWQLKDSNTKTLHHPPLHNNKAPSPCHIPQ